jgi:hypothetical protein
VIGKSLVDGIKRGEPSDEHWQRAADLSDLIKTNYDDVFSATLRALSYSNHPDTISALSTCLLEHLLEHDFLGFDRVEEQIRQGDDKLLFALSVCSKFGASKEEKNANRWEDLLDEFSGRLSQFRYVLYNRFPD